MPKLHIDNEDKLNLLPETFYITYYAKKHSKIITRKGLKFKPNTQTQGRYFKSQQMEHLVFGIGIVMHQQMKMATNGDRLLV